MNWILRATWIWTNRTPVQHEYLSANDELVLSYTCTLHLTIYNRILPS